MNLPAEYKKLIALGIDKSANLSDLNDMTDRGAFPMKPWTATKTCGTIALIKKYNITDEETFVEKFQQESKIPLEVLTDQVYEHQLKYFKSYKYSKETIFKYTYCCVVINSLMGNATEVKFDDWAKTNGINLIESTQLLDEKFHTDRLEVDASGKVVCFISIKPQSFSSNFMQYTDVFAGLQSLQNITGIPWKIFFREGENFKIIQLQDLPEERKNLILKWANDYSKEELEEVIPILNKL
jgi:hypothetical protein